jgi:hypothetical protein
MEQITNFIDVVIWPVTLIGVLLYFRSNLLRLLDRITAFEAGGIRTEFKEGMQEVEDVEVPGSSESQWDSKASLLLRLSDISPTGAVVDAWRELELATISFALSHHLNVKGELRRVSGGAAVDALKKAGFLDQSTHDLFQKLREVRNRAVHNPDPIAPSDARSFTLKSLELASIFREKANSNG